MKCDCGERPHTKEECIDAEIQHELNENTFEFTADPNAPELHVCCCSHGARCTCAIKKEYLDPVPEADVPEAPPAIVNARKPRLTTAQSDTSLTVFTNGHHKPVHRYNDAAHKCGAPYKIPIPHSIHGNSDIARRSADHLPLSKTMEQAPSQLQESISSAQQEVRLVRSEHGSPEPRAAPTFDGFNGHLPPLALERSRPYIDPIPSPPSEDYNTYQSPRSFGETYFTAPEDQPALSAGFNMPIVNWSALDLPLDGGNLSTSYSQPPSYASFDHSNAGQPGLTTASSDEVSEIEEYAPCNRQFSSTMRQDQNTSNSSQVTDPNAYRHSSASSFLELPQASMLSSSNLDSLDMDTFLRGTTASPTDFEAPNINSLMDPEQFVKHGITVKDAQKLAHPGNLSHNGPPTEAMGELSIPTPVDDMDPLWAAPMNDEVPYNPEDDPTNVWGR